MQQKSIKELAKEKNDIKVVLFFDITLNVKQNATPIGSTTISKNVTANVDSDFVGSTINAFSADDQIGLSLESTTAVTISPASDTSAYLNIVKIS